MRQEGGIPGSLISIQRGELIFIIHYIMFVIFTQYSKESETSWIST